MNRQLATSGTTVSQAANSIRNRWEPRFREMTITGVKRLAGRIAGVMFSVLGERSNQGFGQLLYHRTAPYVADVARPSMNVTPRRFERQLEGLLRLGFHPWSVPRLLDAVEEGEPISPRAFSVSFDDGFESVYHYAFPIVRRLGIPITVFLTTDYIDADQPFFFDEWARDNRRSVPSEMYLPLRSSQCFEMASSGLVTFGAHSHTHRDFRGDPSGFHDDVAISADIIRRMFDIARVPFAYPFGKPALGYAVPEMVAAVRETGVRCAMTTSGQRVLPGSDPFRWGRFNVYDWDSATTLAGKLTAWYLGGDGWSWAQRGLHRAPSRSEPPTDGPNSDGPNSDGPARDTGARK